MDSNHGFLHVTQASWPLDHGTRVAEVGVEPTKSPPSRDGRFAWFAYPAISPGPRSRTWHAEAMNLGRALARPERVAGPGIEPDVLTL